MVDSVMSIVVRKFVLDSSSCYYQFFQHNVNFFLTFFSNFVYCELHYSKLLCCQGEGLKRTVSKREVDCGSQALHWCCICKITFARAMVTPYNSECS